MALGSGLTGGYSVAAKMAQPKPFSIIPGVAVEKITGLNAARALQFLASCNQASVEHRFSPLIRMSKGETGLPN